MKKPPISLKIMKECKIEGEDADEQIKQYRLNPRKNKRKLTRSKTFEQEGKKSSIVRGNPYIRRQERQIYDPK